MDETARQHLEGRLVIVDALCAAQDRRAEVMTVVASSQDAAEATTRLVRLLDLPEERGATAVLDMQVRRWTWREHERMERVRAELRVELDAL